MLNSKTLGKKTTHHLILKYNERAFSGYAFNYSWQKIDNSNCVNKF